MNIAIIACHVFNRELSNLCANAKNKTRVFWLEQGLHDTPQFLRSTIQRTIDEIERYNQSLDLSRAYRAFDVIVLAYGLCGGGTVGLRSADLPLVIPRCDDCIALFLGSQSRYLAEFHSRQGVFWYNQGWIESSFTPSKGSLAQRRLQFVEMYGEENADYLMEQENLWVGQYRQGVYIASPVFPNESYEVYTREAANYFGWMYDRLAGDNQLLSALVDGQWDESLFLYCPPHSVTEAAYDGSILSSAKI